MVSDDKIQITILILRQGALSRPTPPQPLTQISSQTGPTKICNRQKHKFTNIQIQNYTFCTSNQMGPNSPTLGFRGGTSSCKQVCLFIWRLWLLIWEEITCEPNEVSQESQKIIAPMSDWHVFATLWLRLLIWVEIKTLNHQTQENHWTTKHSWFWKAGSEAKIKPRHKRLIMRWKIIADNGIVKFMQFPETKEATTGEGVEAARSNDEKFCRRFVSFVRNALNANSTKQTIPLIPCMVGFDVWGFANLW